VTEYWQIIVGPLLLFVVVYARGGIAGALERVPMKSNHLSSVMPALVAGIHIFLADFQLERRGWPGRARP
jgi:hypothetical protein